MWGLFGLFLLVCETDEHGAQQREDVSLDESHQNLKTVHEEHHDDADEVETHTVAHAHRPAEEDHTSEAQDDRVACHHVGKETDHKGKRLGEHAEELDYRHERHRVGLEEEWHIRPENILPVLLVAEEVYGHHRAESQEERDVDVSRYVGTTGEDRKLA